MQGLEAAMEPAQFVDEPIEVLRVAGGLLAPHLVFHLALAIEHLGGFAEGLEQFLADAAGQVHIEFLLQVGNARLPLLDHQAAGGFLQPSNDPHLGRFAGPIHPHQTNAIAALHFPGDVLEHLAGGVNL